MSDKSSTQTTGMPAPREGPRSYADYGESHSSGRAQTTVPPGEFAPSNQYWNEKIAFDSLRIAFDGSIRNRDQRWRRALRAHGCPDAVIDLAAETVRDA